MFFQKQFESISRNPQVKQVTKTKQVSRFDFSNVLNVAVFQYVSPFGLEFWIGPQMVFERWLGLQIVPG